MSNPLVNLCNSYQTYYTDGISDLANNESNALQKALGNSGYSLSSRCVQLGYGICLDLFLRAISVAVITSSTAVILASVVVTPLAAIVMTTPLMRIKKIEAVVNTVPYLIIQSSFTLALSLATFVSPLVVVNDFRKLLTACRDKDLETVKKLSSRELTYVQMKAAIKEAILTENTEILSTLLDNVSGSVYYFLRQAIDLKKPAMLTEILQHPKSTHDNDFNHIEHTLCLFSAAVEEGFDESALSILKWAKIENNEYISIFFDIALKKERTELCLSIISDFVKEENLHVYFGKACQAKNETLINNALKSPLHFAVSGNAIENYLYEAVKANHLEAVKKIISTYRGEYYDLSCIPAVKKAAADRNLEALKIIGQLRETLPESAPYTRSYVLSVAIKENDVELFKIWVRTPSEDMHTYTEAASSNTSFEIMDELLKDPKIAEAFGLMWLRMYFTLDKAEDPRIAKIIKCIVNHPNLRKLPSYRSIAQMAMNVFLENNHKGPRWSLQEGIAAAKELEELEYGTKIDWNNIQFEDRLMTACKTKNLYLVKDELLYLSLELPKLIAAREYAKSEGLSEIVDAVQARINQFSWKDRLMQSVAG